MMESGLNPLLGIMSDRKRLIPQNLSLAELNVNLELKNYAKIIGNQHLFWVAFCLASS